MADSRLLLLTTLMTITCILAISYYSKQIHRSVMCNVLFKNLSSITSPVSMSNTTATDITTASVMKLASSIFIATKAATTPAPKPQMINVFTKVGIMNYVHKVNVSEFINSTIFHLVTRKTVTTTTIKPVTTATRTSKRAKKFFYAALHKTASTYTRQILREICKSYGMKCLTYCSCGHCETGGHQHPLHCHRYDSQKRHPEEMNVDFGAYTMKRIEQCCIPLKHDITKLDGLVEHFPLNIAEDLIAFNSMLTNRTDKFFFTIVREPNEQISSYFDMLKGSNYQHGGKMPVWDQLVARFYEKHLHENYTLIDKEKMLYDLIVNSQSKELGWDGKTMKSFEATLDRLASFDFVGIHAMIQQSLKIALTTIVPDDNKLLSQILVKQKKIELLSEINSKNHHKNKRVSKGQAYISKMSLDELEKLTSLQWADHILYEHAQTIFAQKLLQYGS